MPNTTPIKKFADYNGDKHLIDPTSHEHSTSEGWLSRLYNNLMNLINNKAPLVHDHNISDINNLQTNLDDIRKIAYAGL